MPASPSYCGTPTCHVTADHLGSTCVVTLWHRKEAIRLSSVWNGNYPCVPDSSGQCTPDSFSLKFTGQIRDQGTGFDYFNAKYYSPAQGRCTRYPSDQPRSASAGCQRVGV